MNKEKGFHIGTGVTSIIMIFVVLCLTTFAILSYSSANADYRISDESSNYIKKYYQIRNMATREVADINEVICEKYKETDNVSEILEEVKTLGYTVEDTNIILSYDISEKQKYMVVLNIDTENKRVNVNKNYIKSEGKEYEGQGIQLIDEFE